MHLFLIIFPVAQFWFTATLPCWTLCKVSLPDPLLCQSHGDPDSCVTVPALSHTLHSDLTSATRGHRVPEPAGASLPFHLSSVSSLHTGSSAEQGFLLTENSFRITCVVCRHNCSTVGSTKAELSYCLSLSSAQAEEAQEVLSEGCVSRAQLLAEKIAHLNV